MATVHARNATVTIDDSGGTARDISAFCNSVELNFSLDNPEDTAFGDTYRSRAVGLRDVTISIEGHFDTTATTGSDTVLGPLVDKDTGYTGTTVSISPDGGTTTYAGEAVLTSYTVTGAVEDIVTFSAEFAGQGGWDRT